MRAAAVVARLAGGEREFSNEELNRWSAGLRGQLLLPRSDGYEEARRVWNATVDKKPALIVRCAGVADVVRTVRWVGAHELSLSIRGGGHNIAGSAVCDGGVVLDLSRLRSVQIDPKARRARVEPGATLADMDHEAQAFGLATPLGINSTTGVAGLTLGGGFGWLSRRYGLTVDNLVGADVVTAGGELVRASADENADLFWALRGGGGNFGVVTSFEFELHPVGPEVLAGLIIHPFDGARGLFESYRAMTEKASDDLCVWTVLRKAPPLPFLDSSVHGKEIVIWALCYAGEIEKGLEEIAQFRKTGRPFADVVGPHPYAGWQRTFDPLLTPGARNYWKSNNFKALTPELCRILSDAAGRLPTDECEIFVGHLGGAVNRRPVDATAYPHRDAEYVVNVHTRWRAPSDDARCTAWARELFDATQSFATGGVYVNFISADERRVAAAYGANHERLAELKKKFDPNNVFRANQNIRPG
jgi:FAD/FMN-containing dehydrogenase